MNRPLATLSALAACAALALTVRPARSEAPGDSLAAEPESPVAAEVSRAHARVRRPLEALVPAVAEHPYQLEPGIRPFRERVSVSPGYGFFGAGRMYTLRAAYHPESWLGYEAAIGHDPGHAVHAVMHTFSVVVRRPFPGRLQPYLTGGYGMVIVFPGLAVNAAPVTKNAVTLGGGLEAYVRGDLALRADLRQATVFGEQRDRPGIVAYPYTQGTIGLSFYRSVRP